MTTKHADTHHPSRTTPAPLKAALIMVAASVGYAAMGALVKVAGRDLPVMTVVLGRSLVTAVAAVALVRARGLSWRPGNPRLLAWRCVIGFVALCCYFAAITLIPLANAVTLQFSSPLFVALISALWLGERAGALTLGCVVVAMLGAALIVAPDPSQLDPWALLALASAVLAGVAYVMVRKLRDSDEPEIIVLYFSLFALVGSAPLAAATMTRLPTLTECAVLVGVGVAAFAGQILMTYAFRYGEAAFVSAFSYATPLFSAALGLWLFTEVPGLRDALGALLIVGSGITLSLAGHRRQPPPPVGADATPD